LTSISDARKLDLKVHKGEKKGKDEQKMGTEKRGKKVIRKLFTVFTLTFWREKKKEVKVRESGEKGNESYFQFRMMALSSSLEL